MSRQPPTPDPSVPERLADQPPDVLQAVARYADRLASHRERTGDEDGAAAGNDAGELPEGVPAKATTTVKEINGNRYYYWQWRDGSEVRSKYKGPVSTDE